MTEAIGDTGAARSLVDMGSARSMGLPVQVARGSEFGTYFGPGSVEKPYAGRIAGPVAIRLSDEVHLEVSELKVIHHVEPLVLIGADVLCGGHRGWSFRSMGVSASGGGLITFAKGRRTCSLALINAPVLGRPKFTSTATAREVDGDSTSANASTPQVETPTTPATNMQDRRAMMMALVSRRGQRL